MMADNVTLIVKAPNQQIEDQNIECRSSWTVGQLKGHLSEVYPSKPTKEEQKIIYSGQLLDDNAVIKDILRNYDDQFTHTMHLVCSPKKRMPEVKEASTDGLRHRNVVPDNQRPPEATPRPEVRQNDQNHTVEMQNYLSSFVNNYGRVPPYPNNNLGQGYLPVPNDPALMANHMMMMQQAYMQYMQQYANMWQATGNAAPAPPPAEAPLPAPAHNPEAEDGRAGRDWLDHIYAASRFAILLSLLYVYGSPARLLLVIILASAAYLHHIGFFRDMRVNAVNNERRNVQAQNEPRNARRAQPQDENIDEEGRDETNNDNRQEPNPPNEAVNNDNENQPSLLAVTWMIFTTFFASLIPDTN